MSKRYGKRFKPSKWLKPRAERGESFHGHMMWYFGHRVYSPARRAAPAGYAVARIHPYDFFPVTHHVEALALLDLRA